MILKCFNMFQKCFITDLMSVILLLHNHDIRLKIYKNCPSAYWLSPNNLLKQMVFNTLERGIF